MTDKPIVIVQLYSRDMNIYGDFGNVLTLQRRLQWHGYGADVYEYNQGDEFPRDVDIVVGGGGQDSGQTLVQSDLLALKDTLISLAEEGLPMLAICGLYQLFGRFFKTQEGTLIHGIGLLDIETHAGSERLIGNTICASSEFGDILGYENHSGQTLLGAGVTPLGRVTKGAGNNGEDGTEGARYHNVIASYLHGSMLPINPRIADFLIETAVVRKFGEFSPGDIDDRFAENARAITRKRPR